MTNAQIGPSLSIKINDAALTPRQIEVLIAIYEEKSQNKAAAKLGISVPVLHRYLGQIEQKTGVKITESCATGTKFTAEGLRIINEYLLLDKRLEKRDFLNVRGTPISQELLMKALSTVDPEGKCDLLISDDRKNIADLQTGLADLIILDDPLYLFEAEDFAWATIGEDRLLHEDRGERYAYFKYGAQRIGFRYLDSQEIPYRIERVFTSVPALIDSGLSFFINESMALRRGLAIKSSTSAEQLVHEITAVYSRANPFVEKIIHELKRLQIV
ncbi:LysR family transcriptional regulator [Candidatus Methanomassiliicoccus intestinalis]|uniref:LysR family transcriptional regulator n=1 Tax=Candidatus Methanomassiliicoccus intestinalis TaxID=1406512 RepID=UPI0037DD9259